MLQTLRTGLLATHVAVVVLILTGADLAVAADDELPPPIILPPRKIGTAPPMQSRPKTPDAPAVPERPAPEVAPEDDGATDEVWDDETWGAEDFDVGEWDEDEDDAPGRLFLYKELVVSTFYSKEGIRGLPSSDMTPDHWGLSPRPPGSYVGVDLVNTVSPSAGINKHFLPDWLPLTAMDLHPRLVFDPMEANGGIDRVIFAPQDFWLRFNPWGIDRLSLRVGQFVLPYGVNPVLAPRQRFILPLEALDLGLKWDWGAALKGPAGDYDWEVAATIGSGEGLHGPHLFDNDDRTSYLLSGRFGAPTYWEFQYGASFLYGDLPVVRGPRVMSPFSISRWRVGLDAFYKPGTFLVAGAQLTYGEDGHGDDAKFVMMTGGKPAQVLGYRLWLDWVVPTHQDLRISTQLESVIRDLGTPGSDDTALTLELQYSLTDSISVMLDYRFDIHRAMGEQDHALFLTFVYYGL